MKSLTIITFFTCLLQLIAGGVLAQEATYHNLDSIKAAITPNKDTNRVNQILFFVQQNYENNIDTSIKYNQMALSLSTELGYTKGKILSLALYSEWFINSNPLLGFSSLLQAHRFSNKYPELVDSDIKVYILSNLAFTYNHYGFKDKSHELILEAMGIIKREKLKFSRFYFLIRLIGLLIESDELDMAKTLILENANKLNSVDARPQLALIKIQFAEIQIRKGNVKDAFTQFEGIEELLDDRARNSTGIYMLYLNTKAKAHQLQKEYNKAKEIHLKCIELNKTLKNNKWSAIINRDLSELYYSIGNYNKATTYAQLYLEISIKNDFKVDILKAYRLLAKLYEHQKQYNKAYSCISLYASLNDSTIAIDRNGLAMNTMLEFEVQLKEEDRYRLEQMYEKSESDLRDKKLMQVVLIIISTIVFLSAIFSIYLFIQNKFNLSLLKDKSRELADKNIHLESKNTELEVLNAEKNTLIGIVSHDLKAPISRIEALINLIKASTNLPPEELHLLDMAHKETLDTKVLISKILDSETQKNQTQTEKDWINLNGLVQKTSSLYEIQASQKNIEIQLTLPPTEVLVRTNADSLSRVLENLISNAIKFSPFNKKVYISLMVTPKMASITIKDEGPGLTPNDQKNMFKKYHRLSAQPTGGESSTGLGLYIVKALVNELNASIIVESKIGFGATFTVNLPIS